MPSITKEQLKFNVIAFVKMMTIFTVAIFISAEVSPSPKYRGIAGADKSKIKNRVESGR